MYAPFSFWYLHSVAHNQLSSFNVCQRLCHQKQKVIHFPCIHIPSLRQKEPFILETLEVTEFKDHEMIDRFFNVYVTFKDSSGYGNGLEMVLKYFFSYLLANLG